MGVYHGPVCRFCRREGMKLYLKGNRCESAKCPFEGAKQRNYPPGMHAFRRVKVTEFGQRLREKQKLKRVYGLRERQLKKVFGEAERMKGNTGANLIQLLERRLDNVIYRAGMALSPKHARQMVVHGLVLVNGRKLDIPSARVAVGDIVSLKESERIQKLVAAQRAENKRISVPSWLAVTTEGPVKATVAQLPDTTETAVSISVQLVVEFCAR
ncbi:MAG: 30S ribosomal protein S4 [Planctomycetes bacterium]|nr:30S ribosomal protein S4 [Planctomycetota bacterium]